VTVYIGKYIAFFIKYLQNFDWGILKQNYSDIPLHIIKKRLFVQSAFKMGYVFLQNYKKTLALRYPNPL